MVHTLQESEAAGIERQTDDAQVRLFGEGRSSEGRSSEGRTGHLAKAGVAPRRDAGLAHANLLVLVVAHTPV